MFPIQSNFVKKNMFHHKIRKEYEKCFSYEIVSQFLICLKIPWNWEFFCNQSILPVDLNSHNSFYRKKLKQIMFCARFLELKSYFIRNLTVVLAWNLLKFPPPNKSYFAKFILFKSCIWNENIWNAEKLFGI